MIDVSYPSSRFSWKLLPMNSAPHGLGINPMEVCVEESHLDNASAFGISPINSCAFDSVVFA